MEFIRENRDVLQGLRDALGRALVRVERRRESESRVRRAAAQLSADAPASLDAALEYAFAARPGGVKIAPNQVRSELRDFLALVQELQPRAVLEIGTALGGTLFLLTRAAAEDAVLVSIDLSSNDLTFGGGRVEQRAPLYEAFARGEQRVHFLVGNSQTDEMRARVENHLDGRELDVLFIDGDHTEEGVRRDFELYRELVRPGGVIAFHDIIEGRRDLVGGVPAFWRSIKTPASLELVRDREQGGWGIGVVRA